MDRAIYFSGVLGVDVGMFYKRRNLHTVVNGRNPIAQHEYLGTDVEGKNVLIVDDLLASGESVLDTVRELNERGAAKIFVMVTFGQFTSGPEKFDALYAAGKLTGVYCTNLTYVPPHIQDREWFRSVDMSKYIAKIFYCLNHDHSIAPLRNAKARAEKAHAEPLGQAVVNRIRKPAQRRRIRCFFSHMARPVDGPSPFLSFLFKVNYASNRYGCNAKHPADRRRTPDLWPKVRLRKRGICGTACALAASRRYGLWRRIPQIFCAAAVPVQRRFPGQAEFSLCAGAGMPP